jgi:hypothetical protein
MPGFLLKGSSCAQLLKLPLAGTVVEAVSVIALHLRRSAGISSTCILRICEFHIDWIMSAEGPEVYAQTL